MMTKNYYSKVEHCRWCGYFWDARVTKSYYSKVDDAGVCGYRRMFE